MAASEAESIQVSLVPEFETLPAQETTRTRAVVSLKAMAAPKRNASLNLMLVLDTSSAMKAYHMDLLKAVTKYAGDSLHCSSRRRKIENDPESRPKHSSSTVKNATELSCSAITPISTHVLHHDYDAQSHAGFWIAAKVSKPLILVR